jgi:hypothetical protein
MITGRLGMLIRGVVAGAVALTVASLATPVWPGAASQARAAETKADDKPLDQIILKSGTVVRGEILEETASTIRIRVVVAGISAPTTYQKSEILEIKRAAAATPETPKPDAGAEPKAMTTTSTPAKPAEAKPDVDPNAAQLYIANLKGRFGVDVSETPLKQLFEDVDKTFNDLVPGVGAEAGRKVVDPSVRQNHIVVLKCAMDSPPGFSTIFRTEQLAPIVIDEIVLKGRRVIFWVERAGGGAAFLPWVSSEIYFTEDGKLGGIAELDEFSSGDHMVDEKLISAFLGHAEGFAIKGGYGDHLPALRAMIRRQNWLAVRFEGGRPVYLTRLPTADDGEGWQILSDSGEGEYKDESAIGGNDSFVLDAEWAVKLGIAKGTADSVDDLAFALGVNRSYVQLEDARGSRIFADWKKRIDDTVDLIFPEEQPGRPLGRLWREFNEIRVTGDYPQRKRDRGRKLQILRNIRALVGQYSEVFDTDGNTRARLDVMIAELQLEAEQDARANRSSGS